MAKNRVGCVTKCQRMKRNGIESIRVCLEMVNYGRNGIESIWVCPKGLNLSMKKRMWVCQEMANYQKKRHKIDLGLSRNFF